MKNNKLSLLLSRTENFFVLVFILLIAIIPVLEVIARKFFHTGIPNSNNYIHHLVLLIAFTGGMITSREGKHLSLSLDLKLSERINNYVITVNAFISTMVTSAIFWSTVSFVLNGFDSEQKIGIFPVKIIAMVMFIGYGVMSIRFITAVPKSGSNRILAGSGIIVGTVIAIPSIINALSSFNNQIPELLEFLIEISYSINSVLSLPMIIILAVSALIGVPIFVVLGGIAYMLFAGAGEPLEVIPNEAYSMLISHTIPAIPLFTVAGFILSESRAGERLVKLFKSFFSWFPGGLAIMAILVCSFFTTFTGASGVTILALGGLLSFILVKGKYKKKFNNGLLTASGSIGLLFPPSLPIIIYGVTAGISIKKMFLGGIIPGFVMTLALVTIGIIYAVKKKVTRETFKLREAWNSFKGSISEILLPIIILICFFGGITTIVESGAIAVIYLIIFEVFVHKDLKISQLPDVMLKCIPIIGGILTILALAKGLSYYIIDAEIPMELAAWVSANISSKYVFLLLLNFVLLITGCFMDIYSAILVVAPLIIPLGNIFGVHPVHLGIIFLANMELGYLTPPVGLNLFLASYRFEESMGRIYKDVLPFLLVQIVTVLLITYIPFFSTGLLNLLN